MKTILVDAVQTFVIEDAGIFGEMQDLLERYPNKKIILTNANDEEMEKFGLHDMPYPVFTLKHEPDKTDPKFFKTMLKNFNLQAQDVIYFEHNPEAVKSAQSVGITAYHYDAEERDLEALKRFLDENA
ncbi:hypothetical protein CMO91_02140 [Candidatus Woesearchaeota archaeon]|nr:hypothetical protein [Candidatus Woesearchaeota archaeon]|tara:strand:+ start:1687 stop:2070 length:384 start_codon:yes stop_codon:yes gene_type:complete